MQNQAIGRDKLIDRLAGRTITIFMLLACCSLLVALLAGVLGSIYYTSSYEVLQKLNLSFQTLRPLHTGGAGGWIYLAAVAIVFDFLFRRLKERGADGPALKKVQAHISLLIGLWTVAGLLALVTLPMGIFSGREYVGFHPVISLLILAGWLVFASLFFKINGFSLRNQPVYVWMWVTGLGLFVYSFCEAHAYLLDYLSRAPVRDLAVQWKSYGTLVGSFNLLVYGALMYLGARGGDKKYAYSKLAFFFFFLGILNSLTNYGHHTYHLPQSMWVKWISFTVSMTEIIIFFKILLDLFSLKMLRAQFKERPAFAMLLGSVTIWTFLQLFVALLISVPPINTLFHGTHVILAHSMGSMVGIDTMALLATAAFLFANHHGNDTSRFTRFAPAAVIGFNLSLFVLWGTLVWIGVRSGLRLYMDGVLPRASLFPDYMGPVFLVSGTLISLSLVVLLVPWVGKLGQVFGRKP